MNLFVYTGRLAQVEVGSQTFVRGKPVPVSSRMAAKLDRSNEFERFRPPPQPVSEPVSEDPPQEVELVVGDESAPELLED